MKKTLAILLAAALTTAAVPSVHAREAGGCIGGFVGCCFGMRTAADYNEGKDLSLRDWIRAIPFVSIVGAVWDTIDGYHGVTNGDLRAKWGETYY